jgi:hypothetical protein
MFWSAEASRWPLLPCEAPGSEYGGETPFECYLGNIGHPLGLSIKASKEARTAGGVAKECKDLLHRFLQRRTGRSAGRCYAE